MRSVGLPELAVLAVVVVAVVMLVRGIRDFRRTGSGGFNVVWSGAVVGAVVGFFLRPSVPFIGQLPLHVVITRGASLSGLDTMLRGAAETSFNYVVAGAILGGAAMALLVKTGARSVAGPASSETSVGPPAGPGSFCTNCGAVLAAGAKFCSSCGTAKV